jgi:hypothetical protein
MVKFLHENLSWFNGHLPPTTDSWGIISWRDIGNYWLVIQKSWFSQQIADI